MESLATVPPTKPRFPWAFWLLLLVPVVLIFFSHPTKFMLTWEPYRTMRWYWGAGDFKALLNRINFLAILVLLVQAILPTARWILRTKPSLPSQESETDYVGETATLLPNSLPWQFWLWQCIPMAFLILVMPPGKDPKGWFHEPLIAWGVKQPWWDLLLVLIFTIWFSQGVLLAFWLVWGAGHWPYRFCKVMGLAAITTLLPAIWIGRHFRLFAPPGLNPWSQALDPLYLSVFFLWTVGVAFLPALLATGTLYLMRLRLQKVAAPRSSLGRWQFSLKGLSILTLGCTLFLSFFGWFYPAIVAFISELNASNSRDIGETLGLIAIILSSALAALLSSVILYWRNWRVTTAIFGFLLGTFMLGLFDVVIFSASVSRNPLLNSLHVAGGLTLGTLVSLAISRYWIGWKRFKLIRQIKQKSPQGT